jgi:hypothetical protein
MSLVRHSVDWPKKRRPKGQSNIDKRKKRKVNCEYPSHLVFIGGDDAYWISHPGIRLVVEGSQIFSIEPIMRTRLLVISHRMSLEPVPMTSSCQEEGVVPGISTKQHDPSIHHHSLNRNPTYRSHNFRLCCLDV